MKNQNNFDDRRTVFIAALLFVIVVYLLRLLYLQVVESKYKDSADSNAFLKKTIYPARGTIYDRKERLLVFNQPAYDIMFVNKEIQNLDTLDFCETLGITKAQFLKRMGQVKDRRLNPGYSSFTPQIFINQLTIEDYGKIQEKMYKFKGFYIQKRILRDYESSIGAHVLGGLGEVNNKDIETDNYYTQGDYIGKSGVEKYYEHLLRGEKGYEIIMRDAHGRLKGKYKEGSLDKEPIPGKDLTMTIDKDLQAYAEKLMGDKLGSIVAIEPSTGEVLCIVSSPTYDPKLLVGRQRGKNYMALANDPNKPLFDRPLMAAYPPGSTFKTAQALTFLEDGAITPQTAYSCYNGFSALGGRLRVACHAHYSPLTLSASIQHSCNAYYCNALRAFLGRKERFKNIQEGLDKWRDYMVSMGFGYPLGIDLPHEKRGLIPNSDFYGKKYGARRWNSLTIISTSIGQGEILTTPLQICNLAATIANRGYFITPHVVKKITGDTIEQRFTKRNYTMIKAQNYTPIIEGMYLAVNGSDGGTSRNARLRDIVVCGKTGTAENPHGEDHSIFMCFAPQDNPKIALSVYVENGGYGATIAVPMAALLIEKYLKGTISEENKYKETIILNSKVTPLGIIYKKAETEN